MEGLVLFLSVVMLVGVVDSNVNDTENEQDKGTCVEFMAVPKLEKECTSFRGAISPPICIEKQSEELRCIRYETQ